MWIEVPLPLEAMLIFPGFAFAYAIKSFTELILFFSANDTFNTRTLGSSATKVIGKKSLTESNGSLLFPWL